MRRDLQNGRRTKKPEGKNIRHTRLSNKRNEKMSNKKIALLSNKTLSFYNSLEKLQSKPNSVFIEAFSGVD